MNCEYLTRAQARKIDTLGIEEFKIPGIVLMENAGRNCALQIFQRYLENKTLEGSVTIACGPGNNGGDGLVIARHLDNLGIPVRVLLLCESSRFHGDAEINYQIASRMKFPMHCVDSKATEESLEQLLNPKECRPTKVLVDALLGTGAKGNPRSPMNQFIEWGNRQDLIRVSIDIPTGLDCDTGEMALPTFQADLTLTFVRQKQGFQYTNAQRVLGEIQLIDIGVPQAVVDRVLSD